MLYKLIFTFVLFSLICAQCNTGFPTTEFSECDKNKNDEFYCCLLRSFDGRGRMCYKLEKKNYFGQATAAYGVNTYRLVCLEESNNTVTINNTNNTNTTGHNDVGFNPYTDENLYGIGGSNCGRPNPRNATECWDYSNNVNSCCYYNLDNKQGCYSIDIFYKGTYSASFDLTCRADTLSISINLLIYIIYLYLST
jgi:hypothetical protein